MKRKRNRIHTNTITWLILIVPGLWFFCHCRGVKTVEIREDFFPATLDGIQHISFNDHSNERLFSGSWGPPTMGQDRKFYREPGKEGNIRFYAPKPEKYTIKVEADNSGADFYLKIKNEHIPLQYSRQHLPGDLITAGNNTISLLTDKKKGVKIYHILLYPRRIIQFPNYNELAKDDKILHFPGSLRYYIKPLNNESLWLKIRLFDREDIDLNLKIIGKHEKSEYTRGVRDGELFKIDLKKNRFQKVLITPLKVKSGYLRVEESFILRRKTQEKETGEKLERLKREAAGKNLLIILLDATRNDHLGYSGYGRKTSPNLDRLAARSITFTNAYSEASYTLASTGSLLTGLPPDYHGVISKYYSSLDSEITTIGELFKEKGYFTGAISANPNFGRAFNYQQGFSAFRELFLQNPAPLAREFLMPFRQMLDQTKDKPFFIYLHIREPHDPFKMPPPFLGGFQERFPNQSEELDKTGKAFHQSYIGDNDNVDLLKKLYDENLAYGDWAAGRILSILKEKGLYQDTIKIFISDHGEAIGENGMIGHGHVLYQPAIRIPLLIQIPGIEHFSINKPATTSDLIKTFAHLLELSYPYAELSRGKNLFDLPRQRRLLARSINVFGYPGYTIVQHPFKLIVRFPLKPAGIKLFNIEEDPAERKNLTDKELIKNTLMFYLFNHLKNAKKAQHHSLRPKLRQSDIDALKTQGYL